MRILAASLLLMSVFLSGCATIKNCFGLCEAKKPEVVKEVVDTPVRFSENDNVPSTSAREYKRMTRQRMEEESQINAQAGSMWVMEGQGAYLFAQNKTRREGDLLNVKIEGTAEQQINTKVTVIKKLLKQLEDEEKKAKDLEEAEKLKQLQASQAPATDATRAPASTTETAVAVPPVPPPAPVVDKDKEKEEAVKIDTVPTRIVEKQPDGNYRLKGAQPFMIGKREYKVIITGVIRPEDFNDEGVSSAKLLDPQYDVVSLRKKEL